LPLELRFILDAVIAGQATAGFVAFPVIKVADHVLSGNAGHGSKIVLPDF
jgi:hypothetical protein